MKFEEILNKLKKKKKFFRLNGSQIRDCNGFCPLNVLCGNKYGNSYFGEFARDLKLKRSFIDNFVTAVDNHTIFLKSEWRKKIRRKVLQALDLKE